MRYITFFFILFFVTGCSSTKVRPTKIYLKDLMGQNQLYSIKNNSYFYFMIDSVGNKHLVKMNTFNSDKVLWVEKLNRVFDK